MEEVLSELNKTPGLLGSFVVAEDGEIIASDFVAEFSEDLILLLGSTIISTVKKAVERMNKGLTRTIFVETDKHKLFFNSVMNGFLVAICASNSNVSLVRVEVKTAAQKIDNLSLDAG